LREQVISAFFTLIEVIIGAWAVGVALFDVFQSIVVPRMTARSFRISPLLVRNLWALWRRLGQQMAMGEKQEDFLGSFAPLALVFLIAAWVTTLIFGYGLLLYALKSQIRPSPDNLATAFYLAGTSLLTIGFGDLVAVGTLARFVLLTAAASGLAVVALGISFMFTLHGSFQKREVQVLTLDSRAGTPPSGVTMLETFCKYDMMDSLPATFAAWEVWSAEILESHRAFPLLYYFRSSHDSESWVGSLGAVLDAATLVLTTIEAGPKGAAKMMYGLGSHAVLDLAHFLNLKHDNEPGVERLEFELARQRLARAGYKVSDDEESWQEFQKLRGVYAAPLNAMARHFIIPPSQWIGDRSSVAHLHQHAKQIHQEQVKAA